MVFSEKIKILRKNKQLSQQRVADDLHISRSVIAKMETGIILPSISQVKEIADYFGVSFEDLLGDDVSIVVPYKFVKVYFGLHGVLSIIQYVLCGSFILLGFVPMFSYFYNGTICYTSIMMQCIELKRYICYFAYSFSLVEIGLLIICNTAKKNETKMILYSIIDVLFVFVTITMALTILFGLPFSR